MASLGSEEPTIFYYGSRFSSQKSKSGMEPEHGSGAMRAQSQCWLWLWLWLSFQKKKNEPGRPVQVLH